MQLPTPDELAIIDQTFADRNIGGFVDGNTAREVFMASQLPNDVLSAIWRLSDTDGDSQLSHLEFRTKQRSLDRSGCVVKQAKSHPRAESRDKSNLPPRQVKVFVCLLSKA